MPIGQARVLARLRRCGGAFLDRGELGQTWRYLDGGRPGAWVIAALLARGLIVPAGDALLPEDTQTVRVLR